MKTHNVLAFDPGKRTAAWAVFREGKLASCGMEFWKDEEFPPLERRFRAAPGWEPMQVLIEFQQIYTTGRHRTRKPADVLACTLTAGRIAQAVGPLMGPPRFVLPHDWKGSVNADVMTDRIVAMLKPAELVILRATKLPQGVLHNVIDAIGIGLWAIDRLGRMAKKNASREVDQAGQTRQTRPSA